MLKYVFLFVLIASFISCKHDDSNDNSGLTGKWKLIEILADPGDGSGTFHPVSSQKTIQFHADGTVTSNGEICGMSTESDSPTAGTYSLTDSTIISDNCKIYFEISGNNLILNYPCIEPCQGKFKKL